MVHVVAAVKEVEPIKVPSRYILTVPVKEEGIVPLTLVLGSETLLVIVGHTVVGVNTEADDDEGLAQAETVWTA